MGIPGIWEVCSIDFFYHMYLIFVALIRFCVKQCKPALSLSLHSLKGSMQISVDYEHSPLVLMQGMNFAFPSIHVGG